MSIIIVGIEVPKNCFDCPCCNGENGYCQLRKDYVYGEVPRSCPIIPVPNHGRLIDAGALREAVGKVELEAREEYYKLSDAEEECEYEMGVWDGLHMAAKILSTTPTIIPSSEQMREDT